MLHTRANVVDYDELMHLTKARSRPQLIAWLEANKVPYHTGVTGKPFTTVASLDKAMGTGAGPRPAKNVSI